MVSVLRTQIFIQIYLLGCAVQNQFAYLFLTYAVDANIEVGAKYIRISFTMYYVLTPTQANISNLDRH